MSGLGLSGLAGFGECSLRLQPYPNYNVLFWERIRGSPQALGSDWGPLLAKGRDHLFLEANSLTRGIFHLLIRVLSALAGRTPLPDVG